MENDVKHVVRGETLFAGLRKPIHNREELIPRIELVKEACDEAIAGPLIHIFRFDTPVYGFDSEIGFPVSEKVNKGEIKTHTLREMHFFSSTHRGTIETLRETCGQNYAHMSKVGLAPELELVEIYHHYDPENQGANIIETQASFLAWPEVYREQLLRVLGPKITAEIWAGGEKITPFTLVDERAAWVAGSIEKLKERTTLDQQFDILSRVALVRPIEDTNKFMHIYQETGDVNAVLELQHQELSETPTGGFIDPPRFDGKVLHLSKVAYNRKAYDEATTPEEIRKAYCFCSLIREAIDPQVDPIFCYRAAGWARQFWEPILGTQFKSCRITHSILLGDKFCAWDYELEEGWDN